MNTVIPFKNSCESITHSNLFTVFKNHIRIGVIDLPGIGKGINALIRFGKSCNAVKQIGIILGITACKKILALGAVGKGFCNDHADFPSHFLSAVLDHHRLVFIAVTLRIGVGGECGRVFAQGRRVGLGQLDAVNMVVQRFLAGQRWVEHCVLSCSQT